jgi:hypothetical protein
MSTTTAVLRKAGMGILSRVFFDQRMSRHATVDGPHDAAALITGVDVIDVWRVPPSLIRVSSPGKGFPEK